MRRLELQPTEENLIKTYQEDSIKRNKHLHGFVKVLDAMDEQCAIALDGQWGSGKTFFIKQAKMIFEAFNPHTKVYDEETSKKIKGIWSVANGEEVILSNQVCVYYDAWENDNDEDPLLSIVLETLKTYESDNSFNEVATCIDIIANIADIISGKPIKALLETAKNSNDPFVALRRTRELHNEVERFFDSLLPERGDRLIIFIDELDRCKPGFAIRLLERVKHYFKKDNITFVFSINSRELENTIRQYYGTEFNASKYLDRFFDFKLNLPKVNTNQYLNFIGLSKESVFDIVMRKVISTYQFELREVAKYIRLTKIAAYKPTHSNDRAYRFAYDYEKGLEYGIHVIVPIMTGLRMHDTKEYYDFIEGRDPSPLFKVIQKENDSYISDLFLDDNESYVDTKSGVKKVTLQDKLDQLYKLVFLENENPIVPKKIGKLTFAPKLKEELNEIANLLSDFASFEIENG